MGNLRQKMTDEEWNELGLPSKKTLLDIIDLDGHPDTIIAIIDHPKHYGGANNEYEAIKVIDAWGLDFTLGNVVKYISRAGKKNENALEDLRKASWYLDHAIKKLS